MTAERETTKATLERVQPLFICLGVPKAGTTWIHRQLEAHPDVGCTYTKEIHYWNSDQFGDFQWYVEQFPHGGQFQVYAEVAVGYLRSLPIEHMATHIPNARFMVSLRNPYERAWSSYWQSIRTGAYKGDFESALTDLPKIVDDSKYAEGVRAFLSHFPRERLLVMRYEDLARDAKNFIRDIYSFAGVDPTFVPPEVDAVVNAGRKYSLADGILDRAQRFVKRLGLQRKHLLKLGLWKPIEAIYAKLATRSPIPPVDERALQALDPYLAKDVADLGEILQMDFSDWRSETLPS
jgi:hypothetical protein